MMLWFSGQMAMNFIHWKKSFVYFEQLNDTFEIVLTWDGYMQRGLGHLDGSDMVSMELILPFNIQ